MNDCFLPVTREEMLARGWDAPDFVFVTGDAYVDHPSFGCAILTRVLEAEGWRVAVLPQPDWKSAEDFRRFGRPHVGFLVSAGVIDSMVNHYTVARRPRGEDVYSPGGRTGMAAGPCDHRLYRPHSGSLRQRPRGHRRGGGVPAPVCAL